VNEAPIFIRAYDLHSWLLDRFDTLDETKTHLILRQDVLRCSRKLLDAISLALARFDQVERLLAADEHATLLRVQLRLASEKKLLQDRQLVYATGELADIGRQLGGWRRSVEGLEEGLE